LPRYIILLFFLFVSRAYSDSLSIFFLGDTYFGESYQTNSKYNEGVNVIEEYGYDYFFENVKDLLSRSDYTIANLETSLHPYSKEIYSRKPYSHWSYGDKTCQHLVKYGIDAVSLGNNHVMDYGLTGYTGTINLLDKHNISHFGTGTFAALEADIRNLNSDINFKIAVFGGFEYRASYDTLYNFYADTNKAGVYKLDIENLKKDIQHFRHIDPYIYIIFFPHWGKNYKQAMDYQKEMGHALIDAGVDLIIGHGSHTVQETEMYKDKWIIYNIGNFIFNAPGRYKSIGAKPYGLMAELIVAQDSKKLRLYPVFTDNKRSDYQVRFLDKDEFEDCGKIITEAGVVIRSTGDSGFFEIKLY
jgi:poly-gamma-glutamate capsule biosynthesis protein CapA/YwtB (metallophosphatase superfamily)